jgi:DNA-binding winged helix-turn-helix (wHTH) protein
MDRAISLEARRVDLSIEPPFRLGRASIDPSAHEITIGRKSERMQPQTLKVLIALHDKTNQVVTRHELVDRCWDGRIVGEDVINRCISLLRRIAHDNAGFRIETVPRGGYRLVEGDPPSASARVRWRALAAAVALVVAVGLLALFLGPRTRGSSPVLAVAVSPFTAEDGSANEKELAAKAQESAVRMLTESGLLVKVAAPGQSVDQLGADLLVSGEVSSDAHGPAASIGIEDLHDHANVLSHRLRSDWAHSADLPDQIGANLAAALSWTGPLIMLDQQPSDSPFMAQLLDEVSNQDFDELRAYEFNRRNAPNAPNSPIAQLAFAMDTGMTIDSLPVEERASAVSMARQAADRARRLAPQFGDVYIPWCLLHAPVRMAECEDHLRAGLAADPQAPFVRFFLSNLLNSVGRNEDALALAYASLAQDQYVPTKIGQLVGLQQATGDTEDAENLYRYEERLWPHQGYAFFRRVKGFVQSGDFAGLERFEQGAGRASLPAGFPPAAAVAKATKDRSRAELTAACPKNSPHERAVECMIALARLGDLDRAFGFAAMLYPQARGATPREEEKRWLYGPPGSDTAYLTSASAASLRRDPRFLPLAERLGLLDYWRSGRLPDFCVRAHESVCTRISARR